MKQNTSLASKIQSTAANNFLWLVIAAQLVVGYTINPLFLSPLNLKVILFACTLNGLLALGQSIALISREIDLSIGAALVFAPMSAIYAANFLYTYFAAQPILLGTTGFMSGGWFLVAILTVIFAIAIGFTNGVIVTKLYVPSFIATIGTAFFMKGMSNVITSGQPISFQDIPEANFLGDTEIFGLIPLSAIVFLITGLTIAFALKNTTVGRRIYAVGGNRQAARLSGMMTDRWTIYSFMLCGLMVGIASVLFMSRARGLDINQNAPFELNSIAIAIMGGISISGGRGNVFGTMQATLIVAILLNTLNLAGFGSYHQAAVTGTIIVLLAVFYKIRESKRMRDLQLIEV